MAYSSRRILQKLGLRNRVQAVVLAYETASAAPTGYTDAR
jgi:DNA-binding NarL/FixJ family response regulator